MSPTIEERGFTVHMSRRRVLVAGTASGVAAVALAPAAAEAVPAPAGFTPVTELGVTASGDATKNREALVAALTGSARCVLFPPGDYPIDNADNAVLIRDFGGQVVMQPGARLVFTDPRSRGLRFRGGANARFSGLNVKFETEPSARVGANECITFESSSDTYLEHTRIHGSAAAGLLFWQCIRPAVFDALIQRTMADGLHFANCQDPRADHVTTVDTGDDGVAFINYSSVEGATEPPPDNTGGLGTNLSVTRSRARGVVVGGQSGVTIRDATIVDTYHPGVLCEGGGGWKVRRPAGVRLERIRVRNTATWEPDPTSPGIQVSNGSASLHDVRVENSAAHGVHCNDADVTLVDVTVKGVTGSPGPGILLQRGTFHLDRATVEDTTGIGVAVYDAARVQWGTMTLRNTATKHHTRRALNVENCKLVFGGQVWVSAPAPDRGYLVGAFGTQRGTLGTVVGTLDSGGRQNVALDNPSKLPVTQL